MPAPRIVATFTGDPVKAFHDGIPARDLTEADWDRLSNDQQQLVADSPIYDLKPKEAKALAADAAGQDDPAPSDVGDVSPPVVAVTPDAPAAGAPDRSGGKRP